MMDHSEHGRGDSNYGPNDQDCPCRGTQHEKQCAESGCGFCTANQELLKTARGK